MKYIRFSINGEEKFGILEGDKITELEHNFLENKQRKTKNIYKLNDVKVLPPVQPGKIIAIGLNYVKHANEVNKHIPEEPMMFMVSPTAVIGQNDVIKLPRLDHRIDFEAELAIVIGKEANHVKQENALEYIFGYTCGNDVTDRDLQKEDIQYTRAKSYYTFKPLGPVIATGLNPNQLDIKLKLNGEVRQSSNTNDLIFTIEEIIEAITNVMTLYPGDVVLTGTPAGVAPLKPGDKIEIEIEGIGKLFNTVEE